VRRLTSVHLDAISSFVTTNDERVGALRATAETGEGDVPRMFVMVGLPSAGKTSRARELAATWDALRLTPDEWMIPLFGQEQPEGKRNVLEGRLIWLALSALRIGVNVVLDFGVWAKVERSALRALAASVGATSELVYLQVDEEEQWRRVQARALTDAATTFEMTKPDLERWRPIFQAPDATRPSLGQRTLTPHRPASSLGKPGWLSGGRRPSPTTDLHDTCSTDLAAPTANLPFGSPRLLDERASGTHEPSQPCAGLQGDARSRPLLRAGESPGTLAHDEPGRFDKAEAGRTAAAPTLWPHQLRARVPKPSEALTRR
jgi:predicted kinase